MGAERLDALLAHRGQGTRSEVRALLRSGVVTVDGVVCRDGALRVEPTSVAVRGRSLDERMETFILHKPTGYACSHDAREAPLVYELLPPGVEAAGRLDRDTSGLLVLSADGRLVHALTHPRRHVWKRYRVGFRGPLHPEAVVRCERGIVLRGEPEPTRPARLTLHGAGPDGVEEATLLLAEGRRHQVRRMFVALGGEVLRLHRDAIGGLVLPEDLAPGATRAMPTAELLRLVNEGG